MCNSRERETAQDQDGRETSSGQDQQYRREALPVAEEMGISTARLRPVQATSIIREIGHFCTASISQATLRRTETTELTVKTNFDRHPGAGLRGLLSRLPCTHQPAIIPLRSSGGESGNLVIALPRRCQATSPDAPTKSRELRGSVVMQERLRLTVLASCAPVASPCLPGQNTRAVIFKAAPKTGFRKRTLRFWVPAVSPRWWPVWHTPRPTARFIEI